MDKKELQKKLEDIKQNNFNLEKELDRSLELLRRLKEGGMKTKSGIMLGLGESEEEIIETMDDLRQVNVDILTMGQYLQPSKEHLPVEDFVTPKKFEYYKEIGAMHIPLVFYHPNNTTFKGVNTDVVGQIDIMPTILNLIGYKGSYFGFGTELNSNAEHFSVTFYNNKYIIFGLDHVLFFQNEKVIGLYALSDKMQAKNLLTDEKELAKVLEDKLKAYIQTYNKSLITNKMRVD